MPEGIEHVWQLFNELSASRDWHEASPMAIKPSEVVAYCTLAGEILDPIEYHLITELDSIYRSTLNGK